jgi:hypothetical protein
VTQTGSDSDKEPTSPEVARASGGGARPSRLNALLPMVSGAWSEREQAKMNHFLAQWVRMLEEELREKEETVMQIMARLDLQDEKVSRRVESPEYQSLLKKTFRDWSGAESEDKRRLIRNLLSNAAATEISSDDVVRMFIDWIADYSELHFKVIGEVYKARAGISRGEIWKQIGKGAVREDSADADLYKLLIRDLSTGSVIRQHRETDYQGNFLVKASRKSASTSGPKTHTSAFDTSERYELTELGTQFVHYAMTELTVRVTFNGAAQD